MGVTIYTKPGCPYCAAAKARLQDQSIVYEEIDVTLVEGARETLLALTGGRAVVPVLVDGEKVSVAPGGG